MVSVGEEGEGHSCRWTKNRKGAGTNSARNLEAVSITSTGGCVKLNTITGGSNQPPQQKTAMVEWVKSTTHLPLLWFTKIEFSTSDTDFIKHWRRLKS